MKPVAQHTQIRRERDLEVRAPEHLRRIPEYLEHQAWLRDQFHAIPRHSPEGHRPKRFDFSLIKQASIRVLRDLCSREGVSCANELYARKLGLTLPMNPMAPNFSGADLRGAFLGSEFGITARDMNFSGADLRFVDLEDQSFLRGNFDGADLSSVNAARLRAKGTSFRGASLRLLQAQQAHFDDCDFSGADMRGASFERAFFLECKPPGTQILEANWTKARIGPLFYLNSLLIG